MLNAALCFTLPDKTLIGTNATSYLKKTTPFGHSIIFKPETGYTGLYQEHKNLYFFGNGARAYSPTLHRFLSVDSISPFREGGLNCYSYALSDPINLGDEGGQAPYFKLIIEMPKTFSRAISNDFGAGTTRNVRFLSDAIYTFDDILKNQKRLNIVAHSYSTTQSSREAVHIMSRGNYYIEPSDLVRLVKSRTPDIETYEVARTIICNSATVKNGFTPIGQTIATGLNLPTKSYVGRVSSARDLFGKQYNLHRRRSYLGTHQDGSHDFRGGTAVMKVPGLYRPVMFYPK